VRITQLVPDVREIEADDLVAAPARDVATPAPFDQALTHLVGRFSERLLAIPNVGRTPELVALGFWTRRAALERLRAEFARLADAESILVPRGLVLHFPPANVDTMFVYSAVLSLLTGNRNLVRLSQRVTPAVELLCDVWRAALAENAGLRNMLTFVTYPHDPETTRRLSSVADVRVIWGGDETIRAIRAIPAPPTAIELAFPDRFSLAAINAEAWLVADEGVQRTIAERFFNDAYWFGQAGCSSPRLVVWCGAPETTRRASDGFFTRVAAVLHGRGHRVSTGEALQKLTFTAEAAMDRPVERVRRPSNELSVLSLASLDRFGREHCGGGLFFEATLPDLAALRPFLARKDQTLAHFGFDAGVLRRFVEAVNGRGLQRVVPLGEALAFHRYWDGFDLLAALTQRVHVRAGDEGTR
jgi:hypothetical protein